jgi:hypothetical protein
MCVCVFFFCFDWLLELLDTFGTVAVKSDSRIHLVHLLLLRVQTKPEPSRGIFLPVLLSRNSSNGQVTFQ